MAEGHESEDWRLQYRNAISRWDVARKRHFHTDVNFRVVRGESATTFAAHKIALAFNSSVFADMFYGSSPETTDPIEIVDMEPEIFETLLKHFYGKHAKVTKMTIAAKVCVAADKYLVKGLKEIMEQEVNELSMDDSEFWQLIVDDKFYSIPFIRVECLNYLGIHAHSLLESILFLNVSSYVMEDLIQLNEILVPEINLLQAIIRWGVNKVGPGEELKSELRLFLIHIRFSSMSVEEFLSVSDSHPGLIDSNDCLQIVKHLMDPVTFRLPMWCCTLPREKNSECTPLTPPLRRRSKHNVSSNSY